jgi:hypothetical protein
MCSYRTFVGLALLALGLTSGCGREEKSVGGSNHAPDPAVAAYLLPSEPTGAQGVLDARKEARDGEEVVVVGRVGGSANPMVEGKLAFTIVDPALKPCNEKEDDGCKTPWDYCCDPPEELRKATALVKVVDDKGKTVATDAANLGIKPTQILVVRGIAKRDEQGNLTVQAKGIFVKP